MPLFLQIHRQLYFINDSITVSLFLFQLPVAANNNKYTQQHAVSKMNTYVSVSGFNVMIIQFKLYNHLLFWLLLLPTNSCCIGQLSCLHLQRFDND